MQVLLVLVGRPHTYIVNLGSIPSDASYMVIRCVAHLYYTNLNRYNLGFAMLRSHVIRMESIHANGGGFYFGWMYVNKF